MKKVERKFKINLIINKKGQVTVEELATSFNVTEETIRRDLKELHDEGLLQKVHGGAVSLKHNSESSLDDRFYLNTNAKEIIAKKAINYIKPFSRILIDFGSTTLAFAEELKLVDNLEIFTNSPLLARTVATVNSSHKIYMLGGLYIPYMHQNVGEITLNSIKELFVDLAVISTAAIDRERGFFNINFHEAEIAKAMVNSSQNCMLLADKSKLLKKGGMRTCSFSQIKYLVTDEKDRQMEEICKKFRVTYI